MKSVFIYNFKFVTIYLHYELQKHEQYSIPIGGECLLIFVLNNIVKVKLLFSHDVKKFAQVYVFCLFLFLGGVL